MDVDLLQPDHVGVEGLQRLGGPVEVEHVVLAGAGMNVVRGNGYPGLPRIEGQPVAERVQGLRRVRLGGDRHR